MKKLEYCEVCQKCTYGYDSTSGFCCNKCYRVTTPKFRNDIPYYRTVYKMTEKNNKPLNTKNKRR
ncbi:hypothetical protein LCGC14_1499170 [marine sediment metagenome]|uniref:Uncharacterized protein n=1 Tax=marine sediment metagenome TaxID=412755 RepID=A0A0F9J4H4_9ZZZZ